MISDRNPPASDRSSRRVWPRRLSVVVLAGSLLLLTAICFRAELLTALAESWVVNDPLTKADAIVVLGGRPDLRPFEAARLYHKGLAPRILYMDVKLAPTAELGLTLSERELTHRILLSQGVPETAMTAVGASVDSTFDESRAVAAWMEKTGASSIIITTDLSQTRRARWVFRKQLKSAQARVYMDAITPKEYNVTNWWCHEAGLIAFQNEFVKTMFYHLKY